MQSVQCVNVLDTNYLAGDKQVSSAPADLYLAARSGRPSHMISMCIVVFRMALTFTMHAAGNKPIFCHYRGNYCSFFTVTAGLAYCRN